MKIRQDLALVSLLIGIILMLILPMPTIVLDTFITINLSLALILIIAAVYFSRATEFSTFPSVILIGTTFRIALSVASTRLILSEGEAGHIIRTFGEVVVGGSVMIGMVIFLIISAVQFIVVTKGAERVAEVAARFALDSMPGKQLAIDADLRAGAITQEEAIEKRHELDKGSQYLGAMDGAMKFVKGDAIAGLIIIVVNLVGGLSMGLLTRGMEFSEALTKYSLLTIGDGLVAQIPSLLMAVCAGIMITRVSDSESSDLGTNIITEVARDYRIFFVAGPVIMLTGFIPGFPLFIFLVLGGLVFFAGWRAYRAIGENEPDEGVTTPDTPGIEGASPQDAEQQQLGSLNVDENQDVEPNVIEDNRLLLIVPEQNEAQLDYERIESQLQGLMRKFRSVTGLAFSDIPLVKAGEDQTQITIRLDGVDLYSFKAPRDCIFACQTPEAVEKITGQLEIEPLPKRWWGPNGLWVDTKHKEKLQKNTIDCLSAEDVIVEVVFNLFENNVGDFVNIREVEMYLQSLETSHEKAVSNIREKLHNIFIADVFRELVEAGVPLVPEFLVINSLEASALRDVSKPQAVANLRIAMSRQTFARYLDSTGLIAPYIVRPDLDNELSKLIFSKDKNSNYKVKDIIDEIKSAIISKYKMNYLRKNVIIICSSEIRRHVEQALLKEAVPCFVFSHQEIPKEVTVVPLGMIPDNDETVASLGAVAAE